MMTKPIYIPAKFIPGDRRQKAFVININCRRDRKVTSYTDNYFVYLFKKKAAVYDLLVFPILFFSSKSWKRFEIVICFASSSTRVTTHTERNLMLQEAVFFSIAPIGDGTESHEYRHVLLTSFHSRPMTTTLENRYRESQLMQYCLFLLFIFLSNLVAV